MDKIILTGKAFRYLAERLGATELWGFADVFQDETEEEIKQDNIRITEELIEQELADMNFDGVFQIIPDVATAIRICVSFDRYISAEIRDCNKAARNRLFYTKDGTTVKLEATDQLVMIDPINTSSIPDEIMNLYPNPIWLDGNGVSQMISIRDLADAKIEKKTDQLILKGFSEQVSNTLAEGIAEKSIINTIVVMERKAGDIKKRSCMLMYTSRGTLLITITDTSAADNVQIEPFAEATWREQLTQILFQDESEAE